MISTKDWDKLKDTFVTKDHFSQVVATLATKVELQEVKDDVKEVKGTVNKIFNLVDKLVKKFDEAEIPVLKRSDARHDRQIKYLAEKTGNILPE